MDTAQDPFVPREESLPEPAVLSSPLRSSSAALRSPLRWLYVHNPFYAISAALVFAGLRASFDTSGATFETGLLMASLTGYTILLAVTALLVVRIGGVWDDARSLLLLIVVMLLAVSVTFDDVLARDPTAGAVFCLTGWALAAIVSEVLLRGLRIRLGPLYRLPYYAMLSVFFLYPLVLAPFVSEPTGAALLWGLFGFSPVMAAAFLLLTPALRRGAAYVKSNGTPWPWPWFPWTLFGVLGFCAAVRSYYLCISLHFVPGNQLVFGPWFLIPLGFAAAVLLLEAVLVSARRNRQLAALAMPVLMVGVALYPLPTGTLAAQFREMFQSTLGGTPAYWTLAAATAFYGYAALRRVPAATLSLTAALLAWAVVGPATSDVYSLASPQSWPLWMAALVQTVAAYMHRDARRWLAAVALSSLALSIEISASSLADLGAFVPLNLALVLVLLLAVFARADNERWLHAAATLLVVTLSWGALARWTVLIGSLPAWQSDLYPLAAAALAVAVGMFVRRRVLLAAGAIAVSSWTLVFTQRGYRLADDYVVGLDRIAWGLAFFLVAAGISLWKARAKSQATPIEPSPP